MTVALKMSDLYAPTLKEEPAEAEIGREGGAVVIRQRVAVAGGVCKRVV